MCLKIDRPPPGQWKKLGNKVIYFYQRSLFDTSKLKFINVETKAQMEQSIDIKNIGLLKTQRRPLIFIELFRETIIYKLNTRTLTMKVFYRIIRANLFSKIPIYHFQWNIIYTLQKNRIIQMRRNKLIRKYQGKLNEIAPDYLVIRLALRCFHESKFEASFFLRLWKVFEKAFNISIKHLSKQYGIKTFSKFGDFIILQRNQYSGPGFVLLPNYYIDLNYFIYGKGQKGIFCLANNEKLRKIECFKKKIYLVIKQQNNIHVARLENNIRWFIFTKLNIDQHLIRPILTKNYLIFTNDQFQQCRDIPIYLNINLQENQ